MSMETTSEMHEATLSLKTKVIYDVEGDMNVLLLAAINLNIMHTGACEK